MSCHSHPQPAGATAASSLRPLPQPHQLRASRLHKNPPLLSHFSGHVCQSPCGQVPWILVHNPALALNPFPDSWPQWGQEGIMGGSGKEGREEREELCKDMGQVMPFPFFLTYS